MDEAEFDKFADEYHQMHKANIRASGEAPEYFAEYKIVDLKKIWGRIHDSDPASILDFGGGIGASVPFFRMYFPDTAVTIADPSRRSLEIASARHAERNDDRLECLHFDGQTLPSPDASKDIVFASCVFHHIPETLHVDLMREVRRVLKPDGIFVIFEHNPWNPLTRHAVYTCPFDENAVLITAPALRKRMLSAGYSDVDVRYRIFFPRVLRALRGIEKWMTKLPLGAQYFAVGMP